MTEACPSPARSADSYWLTRFVILRWLGFVYAVAFFAAAKQILPLIGSHGLLPLDSFLARVQEALGSSSVGFVRLPTLFWFASMSTPEEYPWTLHLVWKLLHNDPGALSLFGGNPFPQKPPRYIRAVLYRYEFAPPGNPEGNWWKREELGLWLPPLSAADPRLLNWLKQAVWLKQTNPASGN